MRKLWLKYAATIELKLSSEIKQETRGVYFWQDQLFITFLVYCLPVSLIALVPCIYVAVTSQLYIIAIINVGVILVLSSVILMRNINLTQKKIAAICAFYFLAIYLINSLGFIGPGVFYLFVLNRFNTADTACKVRLLVGCCKRLLNYRFRLTDKI